MPVFFQIRFSSFTLFSLISCHKPSKNPLFELNAGTFHLRESAKFSVWRIQGTREIRGEQSKIRVSPFRKRRKMPPHSMPNQNRPVFPVRQQRKCSPFVRPIPPLVPSPRFGFDEKKPAVAENLLATVMTCAILVTNRLGRTP